jgi:hypothetical protein
MGLLALIFLIVIHKLEYFLNSKIIGTRIDSPMWLTLIGLVVGERLMGIPGMILAPVVLHYIKSEMSAYQPHSEPVPGASDRPATAPSDCPFSLRRSRIMRRIKYATTATLTTNTRILSASGLFTIS